ncbi:ubiquinol-cytochrome C reductase [Klebsiella variicola]|uniref:ubiquinol-cytochrome C reductase n=1 Tax=Klebsiella variicola TaxID=244366 RepID=UPI002DB5F8B9|nr:ubiquinol-cytochrome C reductase [Klebsiella variicola]MEB6354967.1 ubiquinol-cytochrome C reductase [Klebsiella variicola]
MSLYNDLSNAALNTDSISKDEAYRVQQRADEAASNILVGISAIGSLMYWASDSEEYSPEQSKDDMKAIGLMLQTVSEVTRALTDTVNNAMHARYTDNKKGGKS